MCLLLTRSSFLALTWWPLRTPATPRPRWAALQAADGAKDLPKASAKRLNTLQAFTFAFGSNPHEVFVDRFAKAKGGPRWSGNQLIYGNASNTPEQRSGFSNGIAASVWPSDAQAFRADFRWRGCGVT